MIRKLFIIKLILFNSIAFSQVLTYVGNSALVTIQSQTLVYNGGGLQTAGSAVVNNSGNIMINGVATDVLNVASTSSVNLRLASTTDYGQLYITGVPQANITGKVNKEYTSDFLNGTTGRQQIALPFYNFTIPELVTAFGAGNLNVTNTTNNSSGRFNLSSAFWWNNARARFDQIAYSGTAYDAAGNPSATFINPMTYYIMPRRRDDGTYMWVPTTDKKTFTGTPASDVIGGGINNIQMTLAGAYTGGFGINGNGTNYFGEKYYSYIDDPFRSKTPNWSSDYGLNLYQMANPFLTNIDLKFIGANETGNATDGNNISNIVGVAYYGNNQINWDIRQGSTYGTAIVALATSGVFQSGDITANRLIIKPMGAFMVKLNNNTSQTLNLSRTRRFKFASRADGLDYSVTAAKSNYTAKEGIPADKIVKQVAVVMYDLDGAELDRTYYAVSPTSVTGHTNDGGTQSFVEGKKIYTKEEQPNGGEDYNYYDQLYINEANQIDFKSKEIPLFIQYTEQPYQLKFELYEAGERVEEGLSDGSFYLKNNNGQFVKIVDGESLSMNGNQQLGLYYELPEGATLGTGNFNNSQTVIAKKDAQWTVRFAKNWNKATVEVYSAAGQLLNSKSQISTSTDYTIPLNYQAKSIFVVKAISDKGEVVIKKIVN
ncbi:hypothetical protein [Epilithonimonas arachidiradicis]|uniref:Putative secreted protein (Por secretion system target) n=1 Tax=Epilithonimonas arachidiradicis TaxID=1617282 RepID=A0A420CIG2_9FLAO|nr:hypothetical protein [Epilithonimonas arachidiradicis]RKE78319.1 putative secreted protein (Por secretion system target) [Epilithonimonas arachidiradicis]GGG66796.1 hypothetical protein GCM10007332_31990 [Epilithonimonas arachidiradicis]